MNILQQAIEDSEYNFDSVDDFEVSQEKDIVTVSYLDFDAKVVVDFMIIRTDTTVEDVLNFIDGHFFEAKLAHEYLLELSF